MAESVQTITLLGATGSIGRQTLDVAARLGIAVPYMAAQRDDAGLLNAAQRFFPKILALQDSTAAERLRQALRATRDSRLQAIEVWEGEKGLARLATLSSDRTVLAISGVAALLPALIALESGHELALANKECLVVGGSLLMPLARARGLRIYPVDSEHSAIWQCLAAVPPKSVAKLWLTASGGPFRDADPVSLSNVTPEQALRHPVWSMGAKISIDSATMMNKGLERMEAMHLFEMRASQIGIVIHPESVIHSAIELLDGAILAQLGNADMRLPIQLALTWPERRDSGLPRFDWFSAAHRELHFLPPDEDRFPALRLSREAAEAGGTAPLVLNAANEAAVAAFLDHQLSFPGICEAVEAALTAFAGSSPEKLAAGGSSVTTRRHTVDGMMEMDRQVRAFVGRWIRQRI